MVQLILLSRIYEKCIMNDEDLCTYVFTYSSRINLCIKLTIKQTEILEIIFDSDANFL